MMIEAMICKVKICKKIFAVSENEMKSLDGTSRYCRCPGCYQIYIIKN